MPWFAIEKYPVPVVTGVDNNVHYGAEFTDIQGHTVDWSNDISSSLYIDGFSKCELVLVSHKFFKLFVSKF